MEDDGHASHDECSPAERDHSFDDVWSWLREKGLCEVVYDYESEGPRDHFTRVHGRFWAQAVEPPGRRAILLAPAGSYAGGLGPDRLEVRSCCWRFELDLESPFYQSLGDDPCHYLDYARVGLVTGDIRALSAQEAAAEQSLRDGLERGTGGASVLGSLARAVFGAFFRK
ncbi:MAG: hypothetical protein HYV15_05455 [Elusimicrobia bacterium]|nr:hypothetical protein [Elusimicrobiota bacterium]